MLVIWIIPTLLWLLVHRFSPGAVGVAGLFWPRWRWLAAGVGVGVLSLGLGWLALSLIPASSLDHPDVTGPIVSLVGGLSVAAAALGEEIFFRGFLQGLLDRWRGPHLALWGQAFAFLIPHLLLLLIDVHLYPLVIVQFGVGILLGWLRLRSDSLWPAAVAHVITNVGTGLLLV